MSICHRRMTMTVPLRRFCISVTLNEIMQIRKLSVFAAYRLRHTHHKQPCCSVLTLQNTDKEANLPLSSNVQTLKCCQLQGASPLTPWPGAVPPDPRYRFALRARHKCPPVQSKIFLRISHVSYTPIVLLPSTSCLQTVSRNSRSLSAFIFRLAAHRITHARRVIIIFVGSLHVAVIVRSSLFYSSAHVS